MNNKQLGKKLLEIEAKLDILMEVYDIKPARETSDIEKKLDSIIIEMKAQNRDNIISQINDQVNHLTKLIKEDYTANPPKSLWERIKSKLP